MSRVRKTAKARTRLATKAPVREDGAQTRQHLLEVAGRVFAEQGYTQAMSKEICERAGANIAAVNYHFGGKEGLYAAVLEQAHARLVSIDVVTKATQGDAAPAEKIRTLLTQVVGEIARRSDDAWELRVLSREVLSPTPMSERMVSNQIQPKFRLVAKMIGDVLDVPPTHPAVSRCMISIIGPCAFLLLTDPRWQQQIFPSFTVDPQTLVDHMVAFAMAGLKSVAASIKRAQR